MKETPACEKLSILWSAEINLHRVQARGLKVEGLAAHSYSTEAMVQ